MVRVQITELTQFCPKAGNLLGLCVADGERELKEYLENPSVYVYVLKSRTDTVGVICVMVTPDSVDLLDIAVHPECRGKGYGRRLVREIFNIYKKDVLLEVRASNFGAIAFYEALGFEQISVRKKYYSAPTEDALIYRREI